MKANEAPEKIYFGTQQQNINPFFGLTHKCADTDIEYVRKDAFIEKAVTYIQQHRMSKTKMIEYFKKYMEGE